MWILTTQSESTGRYRTLKVSKKENQLSSLCKSVALLPVLQQAMLFISMLCAHIKENLNTTNQ